MYIDPNSKPEPWEIVRDKLLGVEIYSSNLTIDIVNKYVCKHLDETGEIKEVVYVSKEGFKNLLEDVVSLRNFNGHEIYNKDFIDFWLLPGQVRIKPL